MAELPAPPTPTLTAIYGAYENRQGDGFREHLGASLIGKPCGRALWFDFRWITPSRFSGRMLRHCARHDRRLDAQDQRRACTARRATCAPISMSSASPTADRARIIRARS